MFFILSKTLQYAFSPLTWVVVALLVARLTSNPARRRRWLVAGLSMLFLFGNGFVVNELLRLWEVPATPIAAIGQPYDVAILLTGVTNGERTPRDRTYFEKGADRVTHTLQLYKLGKVKTILITGGSGSLRAREGTEADDIARFLRLAGVAEGDIVLEKQSRNTHENAVQSAAILRARFPGQRYLLVTSAFHLRRAAGCFRRAGLAVDPFSTDFFTYPRVFTPDSWLIPSEQAMARWSLLLHELLGYVTYKVVGYS